MESPVRHVFGIPELVAVPQEPLRIKVYQRRWFILLVFILFSSLIFCQEIQYTEIENVMIRYYNVSSFAIESTSIISNSLYIIGCIPLSYIAKILDIRYSCVIAAIGACIGTWIKVYAVFPDRFVFVLIGHAIVQVWQVIIFTTPVSLSAYWFGPNEVATATALGTMGMVVGMAIFAFIVPIVVQNHENIADIGRDSYYLTLGLAIISTLVVVLVVVFFRNEPPLPPSKSRALQKLNNKQEFHFFKPRLRLIKNKNYLLLWNAQGLIMGATVTVGTIFNRLYVNIHFEHGERDMGKLSIVSLSCGLVGGIIVGRIQDRTKKLKMLLIALTACIAIGQVSYGAALYMNAKWAVYVATAMRGCVMLAYTSTSLETCVEMLYPEPEYVPIAVLNSAAQIYSMILLVISNEILNNFPDWTIQIFFTALITTGFLCLIIMKDVQNRQDTMKRTDYRIE